MLVKSQQHQSTIINEKVAVFRGDPGKWIKNI